MKLQTLSRRWITGAVLAAILASTFAPAAEAGRGDRGNGNVRYKGNGSHGGSGWSGGSHGSSGWSGGSRSGNGHRSGFAYRSRGPYRSHGSTYFVRRSNAGPIIGGFLGGLFLGAALANAAPAGYYYYDPYCGARFSSLESYDVYYRRHQFHHPRVVRVIEVRSGDCVREYRYDDERWVDDHNYRDDRQYQDDQNYRDDQDDRGYEDDSR